MEQTSEQLVVEVRKNMGVITLNRPRVVNALDHEMLQGIHDALDVFEQDARVRLVLLQGAGERGLCAGGDIVSLYRNMDNWQECAAYFRTEYTLNHRISRFSKPYVSLMDGLVLGGGMGVSAYGSHRIVTERTRAGMPETVIGFSPDVGLAHLLARAPQHLGTLMALTGRHVSAADAIVCGLADYFVPAAALDELVVQLEGATDAQAVESIIGRFSEPAPSSQLAENAGWVQEVFASSTVEEVVDGVRQFAGGGNEFAGEVLQALEANSPTGKKVALVALARAREQSLAQTLEQDFCLVLNATRGHDLREGIRAQVIDKDRQPLWNPAKLEGVSDDYVERFFAAVAEPALFAPSAPSALSTPSAPSTPSTV